MSALFEISNVYSPFHILHMHMYISVCNLSHKNSLCQVQHFRSQTLFHLMCYHPQSTPFTTDKHKIQQVAAAGTVKHGRHKTK